MNILVTRSILVFALALTALPGFSQLSEAQQRVLDRIYEEKVKSRNVTYSQNQSSELSKTHIEKRLNAGTTSGAEISVAVNPANPDNLVVSYMLDSVSLSFPILYSNDGGTSWSRSNFNSVAELYQFFPGEFIGGGGDPVFEFDADGNAYFSWIYLSLPPGQSDTAIMRMFWAKSTDGGQTWNTSANQLIGYGALLLSGGNVTGVAEYGEGIFDRQWFDVDRSGGPNDGNVYATTYFVPHASSTNSQEGMLIHRMTPGSGGFSATSYAGTGTSQFGNVVVNQGDGTVHVTYCSVASNRLMHASSTDGGQTFGTPTMIVQGVNLFPTGGTVHRRENSAPSLAIDSLGGLHLVWTDYAAGSFESFYSQSTDGGATWSTAASLSQMFTAGDPFMPTVAASGSKVCISYYSLDNNNNAVYKYALSTDAGASFVPATTLSSDTTRFSNFNQSAFFGDYNRSVMNGCDLYTTWVDGRSGAPTAYLATENVCSSIGVDEFSPLTDAMTVGRAYPNPANDHTRFDITSELSGNLTYKVMDLSGRVISTSEKKISAGTTTTVQIHIGDLSQGIYLVHFKSESGLEFLRKVNVE